MMSCIAAICLSLLIEMKTNTEIFSPHGCVHMESRISGGGKRTDKAHLFSLATLESISGASQEIYGVICDIWKNKLHRNGAVKILSVIT